MNSATLLKIKKHQLELVQLRGFVLSNDEARIFEMSPRDFERYTNSKKVTEGHPLNMIYTKGVSSTTEALAVYYIKSNADTNIKKEHIIQYLDSIIQKGPLNILLIALNKMSEKVIRDYPAYNITVFFDTQLIINPTKHVLSEKIIRRLNDDEKTAFLKIIKPEQAVQVCYDDPIIKFYGFVPGDVIECERFNLDEKNVILSYPVKKVVSTNSIYISNLNE